MSDYELALQSVTYLNTSDNPDPSPRDLQFAVTDFDNTNPFSDGFQEPIATISVLPVNDAPVLSSSNMGTSVDYTQNATGIAIDSQLTVADVDNMTLVSASITINNFATGDTLLFSDQNGISGSFADGTLNLVGQSSIADYEAALQSIRFETTNEPGSKTVVFVVNDGSDDSNVYSRDITIIENTNQPPEVNTTPATTQVGSTVIIDLCQIISDPDNDYNELTISVLSTSSGATTSINGCELSIDYSGTTFSGQDNVVIEACDPSGSCDQNTLTIQVEAITEVNIFNAVSPNNDGSNDFWEIQGLTQPNSVILFNRWGDEVKSLNDVESPIANINLDDLPPATYFYRINSPEGTFEGYVVIKK
ncbi:MAG: gliding motility-associated C-terminal domain-containing protein [Fulvivirga sp.]